MLAKYNMARGDSMRFFAKTIAAFLMTILVGLLMVTPVKGTVLLEDSFDGKGLGTVIGGQYVQIGPSSGWVSGTSDEPGNDGFTRSDVITYNIAEKGLTPLPDQGTVVLELTYYRKGGKEYGTPNATYSTVLDFINPDNKSAFTVYAVWEGYFGKGGSVITFDAPDSKTHNVYGMWVPVGKRVNVGDSVQLAFTWGPYPETDNNVFINAVEVTESFMNMRRQTRTVKTERLLDFIRNADRVRVGVASEIGRNFPDGNGPMYNTVINKLAIHNEILTAADLKPQITALTHDVFAVAGYSGKLVAGDTFTVTMKAEPGGRATFDLGSITGHQMVEVPEDPGTYRGVHTVKYGEDTESETVVGHFTSFNGPEADPSVANRTVTIDTKVYMDVKSSNDLIPADEDSKAGITIVAKDANGKVVKDRELKLTLSTTDEYTGTVGGGSFQDLVGGSINVDWGGVTDSFGEVTAQYVSGFAAKTILVSTKDMVTGDVGVGWVRAYIDGAVEFLVVEPKASALSVAGSMDVDLSREWLTADGKSRSRITAVIRNASGDPVSGHSLRFTLIGENGEIRVIQGKTDSRGRALADYIAGTLMGQVQVEVRDLTSGMVAIVSIELRPDAPAEIILIADSPEVVTGGQNTVSATVTDANGNPNQNVDVLYNILVGSGELASPSVATDEKGNAPVVFTAGNSPGLVTVKGTVISREPSDEEISAAEGAVFLYGLDEDPGRLNVVKWFVEPGDEVVEGQGLVVLEDRADITYTVVAPRDGTVSTFVAEERDRVEYGDTLGYVVEKAE